MKVLAFKLERFIYDLIDKNLSNFIREHARTHSRKQPICLNKLNGLIINFDS